MAIPICFDPQRPCLRGLEPHLFEQEGERRVAWRDPLGIAPAVEVPHAVAVLMSLLDGTRDHAELRDEWRGLAGEDLPAGFLERFTADLEEHLLLDGPRFRAAFQQMVTDYRALPARPPTHAGTAYPESPDDCAALLSDLRRQGHAESRSLRAEPVRGLIAPHIDFTRGGPCYGAAYDTLANSTADIFVVLGIAHSSTCWPLPPPLVTLSRLDYDTPLGRVTTDRAFVDQLVAGVQAAGGDAESLFVDELVQRDEHSIEFQAVWLQHLHGHRPFRMVPVLLGSLHPFYDSPEEVDGIAGLGPFLAALREASASAGGEVCLIAGADLAHVGPRFGDAEPVDKDRIQEVGTADEQALRHLVSSDASLFFEHFAADHNARSVCSVSNLYVLRSLLGDADMELLRYQVAFDPEQTVSFAAAALR